MKHYAVVDLPATVGNGAADCSNRTAPFFLPYPITKNYWTRFTVTGTGRQIVLQTGE